MVETIIPATDTPGAKALNVHQFIQKMVADCYAKTAQETLQKGLDSLDGLAQKPIRKILCRRRHGAAHGPAHSVGAIDRYGSERLLFAG